MGRRVEIADSIDATGLVRESSDLVAPRRRVSSSTAVVVLVALAVTVAWFATRGWERAADAPVVSRVSIQPSAGESWVIGPHDPDFAISPDGERIAYIGSRADGTHLVVRRLDEFEGLSLGRFGGVVRHPFFSPDGKWVGFVDGNVLRRAAVDGTRVANVCVLPGQMSGAAWGGDDTIIFGTLTHGLFRVPSSGGEVTALTTDARQEGKNAAWPYILPGDEALLFASVGGMGKGANSEIRVRSLVSGEEQVVVRNATFPRFADTGHLLYVSDGTLWGVRFDANVLKVIGEPELVVDGIMIKGPPGRGLGAADVGLSKNGTLVYRPIDDAVGQTNKLVWVRRDGLEEALEFGDRNYGRVRLSEDGSTLAVEVAGVDTQNTDVWVGKVGGAVLTQLTLDPSPDTDPVWTTDGERVIFWSGRKGGGLYWRRADGTGSVEALLEVEGGAVMRPYFMSRDGSAVVYMKALAFDNLPFFELSLEGPRAEQKLALNHGPVAAISPDGRWLSNISDETGTYEIYVQPFPNPEGARWKITTGGGRDPVWSRDGRELFYQNDTTMFAVRVTTDPTFTASAAEALFDGPYVDSLGRWYDVAPDGRFLMIQPGWLSASREAPLHVVLNWTEELTRLVPTQN